MKAYRLSHSRYAADLSGLGAFRSGGRWNPKGCYALYCSEHPCAAILETLIHIPPQILPEDYQLVTLEIKSNRGMEEIAEADLPAAWRSKQYDLATFQDFGKLHLFDAARLGLIIPSAVAYPSRNFIFNSKHPKFDKTVSIHSIEKYIFDPRLVQRFTSVH